MKTEAQEIRGGFVWLGSSAALITYAILGLLNVGIPGIEEIVTFIQSASGGYIYAAAFIAILIEGLYLVGNFFPGSTFVLLVAVLSQLVSLPVFILTILTIFIGWCLAGAINITLASKWQHLRNKRIAEAQTEVKDKLLTTWFPAFRASYEVAQIAEGGRPVSVFMSSVRVKFWASLFAAGVALLIPLFIDISEMNNEEGFASVLGVAFITASVGLYKIYTARSGSDSISDTTN